MIEESGRVGSAETGPHASHEAPAGLRPTGFDPARFGGPYAIPWPPEGCRIHLNLIPRPKGFGLWWSLIDGDGGWFDGGHVSTHRTKAAAQKKARLVGDYLASRDSDGPRMAETNEDSSRGGAGPARAEGIAQGQEP
jgi:hypothetical protein